MPFEQSAREGSTCVSTRRMERLRRDLTKLPRDEQIALVRAIRADRLVAKRRPDPAGARAKRRDDIMRWFGMLAPEWQQHVLNEVQQ